MFIDSNILINAINMKSTHNDRARRALAELKLKSEPKYVSGQVMREYFSGATRPSDANGVGMPPLAAAAALPGLLAGIGYLDDTTAVRAQLMALVRDKTVKGKQIHDANIVATMLAHGERELLTFNGSDFARYADSIDIVAP